MHGMKKDTIAICTSHISERFQTDTINAILVRARELGYRVQTFSTFDELTQKTPHNEGEASVYDLLNYDKLLGVIIFCERIKDQDVCRGIIEKAKKHNIPVVSVDQEQEGCFNLGFAYGNAFEMLVRHLLEHHGCKRFIVMGGYENNSFSDERIEVARSTMAEFGITLKDDDIFYGDFWEMPCREAMERFFESGKEMPDAFIAINDAMAIAICDVLSDRGYKVPDDVLVTGFDGLEIGKYYTPHITSAAHPIEESGRKAVEIIDSVYNPHNYNEEEQMQTGELVRIPFELVISQSCGCKPIEYTAYAEQMRRLFYRLEANYLFTNFMDEMTERMASVKTMSNIASNIDHYADYFEEYPSYFLCLKADTLSVDEEFGTMLEEEEDGRDMVLFYQYLKDEGASKPYIRFSSSEVLPDFESYELQNVIILPFHLQDDVFGYMVLQLKEDILDHYKLSQFVIAVSHSIAAVKAHCLMKKTIMELEEAKRKIEELYIIDPLTGVYNRRGFYQIFGEYARNHDGKSISVISADLDGLKEINDTYGHEEGDYAISTLANALRNVVGERGLTSRFGGDEFVAVYLQDDNQPLSDERIGDKLNMYIDTLKRIIKKPYDIGISYGVMTASLPLDITVAQMLAVSDEKMYEMKSLHHKLMGKQK